jgi:hypothetical protein
MSDDRARSQQTLAWVVGGVLVLAVLGSVAAVAASTTRPWTVAAAAL